VTVLIRDDFSGSGYINGRAPDGVDAGNWVLVGGTNTNAEVAFAQMYVFGTFNARVAGPAADSYVQMEWVAGGFGVPTVLQIGARWQNSGGIGSGVFLEFNKAGGDPHSAGTIRVGTRDAGGTITYPIGVTPVATGFGASPWLLRLELEGTAIRVYNRGGLIASGTQSVIAAAGDYYLASTTAFNATETAGLKSFEGGSLVAPVTPPFWTSLTGSREVV